MPRQGKRRRRGNDGEDAKQWKSVNVQLSTSGDQSEDFDETTATKNHYDDARLQRAADDDLPVQPGEDVAMFFGLEVLDSSQYELVSDPLNADHKRLVIKDQPQVEDTSPAPAPSDKKSKARDSSTNKAAISGDTQAKDAKKKDKKDKKKKQANELKELSADAKSDTITTPDTSGPSQSEISDVQMNWQQATGGVMLDQSICRILVVHGYQRPTPIQSETLSAAILGRRNMVGAAPTGSGKTLAFILPILQQLMTDDSADNPQQNDQRYVQAMIVTPTRELAIQIQKECHKFMDNKKDCVVLVGGIALVKQKRLLESHPRIVVGTPGRLWAMISSPGNQHLQDLSQVRYLVLDEADRMAQDHCFPQLLQILDNVHEANPGKDDMDEEEESEDEDEYSDEFLRGLPGVRGEAKTTMLTDELLQRISDQREDTPAEAKEVPEDALVDPADNKIEFPELGILPSTKPVQRQTFIYSATLAIPHTATKSKRTRKPRRMKKLGLNGLVADILEKTRAMGETKVVDLSSNKGDKDGHKHGPSSRITGNPINLPPGLSLQQIKCTQRHKDSHLYAYLVTTQQGVAGPSLIFCNSIAGVRRVGSMLQKLGLPVRQLHANMQQRARFKAVESVQRSSSRAVVVCTDVAARGLDIPSVASVIHYDVARSVETFVHRSGRTARGIGVSAKGCSLSMISPSEDKAQTKILESTGAQFEAILIDGRLLAGAQERTNLAAKVIAAEELERQKQSNNKWFTDKAEEAGIELDENMLEDDSDEPLATRTKKVEAERAKVKLRQLLAEPIRTQRFKKFLSVNNNKHLLAKPSSAPKGKGTVQRKKSRYL